MFHVKQSTAAATAQNVSRAGIRRGGNDLTIHVVKHRGESFVVSLVELGTDIVYEKQ